MKVLLINHGISEVCGVYKYGLRVGKILTAQHSTDVQWKYVEVTTPEQMRREIIDYAPTCCVFNYYNSLLPFTASVISEFPQLNHIGILHEFTHNSIIHDPAPGPFSTWVCADPSIPKLSTWCHKTVRPIFNDVGVRNFIDSTSPNRLLTIGSFGFAFHFKNFDRVIQLASTSRQRTKVRLHITQAHFGGGPKATSQSWIHECSELASHLNVELELTTKFKDDTDMIYWLAENDLNIFCYSPNPGRGISSVVDYAISSERPLLLSASEQFRHVQNRLPLIREDESLGYGGLPMTVDEAIEFGNEEVLKIKNEWADETFCHQWNDIVLKNC